MLWELCKKGGTVTIVYGENEIKTTLFDDVFGKSRSGMAVMVTAYILDPSRMVSICSKWVSDFQDTVV